MHKVFVSYHHENDQWYKEELLRVAHDYQIFIDRSVDTGDISDALSDEAIREKIRDEYLRDSTVTIVLVGTQTKNRKHVDWEIYSSMFDGRVNKKSGILAITLPSTGCSRVFEPRGKDEQRLGHPDVSRWVAVNGRIQAERDYPSLPDRILDNLTDNNVKISVVPWSEVHREPERLRALIEFAYRDRASCQYNLARPMRRRNS
ncbi:MAG: TIR domain-containing protein [Acidobacteria bacterium]|nr:TIR domain-containing protein [Acidobacteriota bacterium]